jgi:alkaline phosphatase D
MTDASTARSSGASTRFPHGIASGDPLADRVVLWTRVTPEWENEAELSVSWEVAAEREFRHKVATGLLQACSGRDYTVKVDVAGLRPSTTYYYRFTCSGEISPVGRTRTLPAGSVKEVHIAVVSCAHYCSGFFHVYRELARREDLDFVLHLGDYIYEYGGSGFGTEQAEAIGRQHVPNRELIALEDYRMRYAQYRSDPDAQAMHAALPVIAIWDDHEIADNAWRDGSGAHVEAANGSWVARKAAAIQAYHEWMPIRAPEPLRPERIYRGFDLGDLISLHVLDARHFERERQLTLRRYIGSSGVDYYGLESAMRRKRELLGQEQFGWLSSRMQRSAATWQVVAQQVLMARVHVPPALLRQDIKTPVSAFAALLHKRGAGEPLTPQEQAALMQAPIPYNLDAWDGYPAERERLLAMAREMDCSLVVLSGDTHNAWASHLTDDAGHLVGVELATPGVSSPGFDYHFPEEDYEIFAATLKRLLPTLVYMDASRRGYLEIIATHQAMHAQWTFVSDVRSKQYDTSKGPRLLTFPRTGRGRLLPMDEIPK